MNNKKIQSLESSSYVAHNDARPVTALELIGMASLLVTLVLVSGSGTWSFLGFTLNAIFFGLTENKGFFSFVTFPDPASSVPTQTNNEIYDKISIRLPFHPETMNIYLESL